MSAPAIGPGGLAIAALLVLASAAVSLVLQLGLARGLLVAALRTIVQLLLVGMVLEWVFALRSPLIVAAVLALMFTLASREILSRQERRLAGGWSRWIAGGSMLAATVVAMFAGLAALRPRPVLEASVLIPLLGIVLGNVMNGVSLSLNTFHNGVVRDRLAIEARLALGSNRFDALRSTQIGALRSGLIPILNQMSAAGVITLPGMMTGQVLAGMPVLEAAKYQILVLLLIAGASCLGAILASWIAVRRISDERDRLRLDRLLGVSRSQR
ncbi:MAG: ABC transporter permease [Burkholderiaceae bacterium]|nr:ABC transporter permease [Burkholderiaceae bacterium]